MTPEEKAKAIYWGDGNDKSDYAIIERIAAALVAARIEGLRKAKELAENLRDGERFRVGEFRPSFGSANGGIVAGLIVGAIEAEIKELNR